MKSLYHFFGLIVLFNLHFGETSRAATKSFIVKKVTYGLDYGAFLCEVELNAGDEATLTLTIPDDDKEKVLDSIHCSHPASIPDPSSSGGNTTITIQVTSASKTTVGVTYLKPINETHRFRHGIEQSKKQLDTYVWVFDRSGSNADWKETRLCIRRGPLPLESKVSMGDGGSVVFPVPELQNYAIELSPEKPLRLEKRSLHRLLKLKNVGEKTLPAGKVRVLNDGVLQFANRLDSDLKAGNDAVILASKVTPDAVSVTAGSAGTLWYEAVALKEESFQYKTRNVTPHVIKNNTDQAVTVVYEKDNFIEIPAGQPANLIIPDGASSDVLTTNLFDLEPEKVDAHVKNLDGKIQIFSSEALRGKVALIVFHLKEIQTAQKSVAESEASKEIVEGRLQALTEADASVEVLQQLAQRLSVITEKIALATRDETKATIALSRILFE